MLPSHYNDKSQARKPGDPVLYDSYKNISLPLLAASSRFQCVSNGKKLTEKSLYCGLYGLIYRYLSRNPPMDDIHSLRAIFLPLRQKPFVKPSLFDTGDEACNGFQASSWKQLSTTSSDNNFRQAFNGWKAILRITKSAAHIPSSRNVHRTQFRHGSLTPSQMEQNKLK